MKKILALSREGLSLNKISALLGRRKSTIYYHVRKNYGRKILPLKIIDKPTEGLGEFLGAFASDGSFYYDKKSYHYSVSIDLSAYQTDYAGQLSEIMQKVFGKMPWIWTNERQHTILVRLYGKKIYTLLRQFLWWRGNRTHTIAFKPFVFQLRKPFLKGVIRGLIAGDGSINVQKHRIHFGVTSRKLALQYSLMLERFGIKSHAYRSKQEGKRPCYHVLVSDLVLVKKFKLSIGLTDPAKAHLINEIVGRR